MNERIKLLAEQCRIETYGVNRELLAADFDEQKFAELIVRECADICMEVATKCAGLEGDGALAKDCAYWIKRDFGVEE